MTTLREEDIKLIKQIEESIVGYKLDEINIGEMYNGEDVITIRIKRREKDE